MFWGLIIKPNKKYSQTVKKAFHLSQAVLSDDAKTDEPVQVNLTYENKNYILCRLWKNKYEHISLDLNFSEGEEISFSCQGGGGGSVHLVGYIVPNYDDDDDEDDDDYSDLMLGKTLKKAGKPAKKASKLEEIKDETDDDDDKDEEDNNCVSPLSTSNDDEEEEEEDDDDEEEDEEDNSSDEDITPPKAKQMKFVPNLNGVANGKALSKEKKKDKKGKQQQQAQQGGDKTSKSVEKTLQGGVKIEDICVGNGPEAKSGKKVQVYYEGRLKSNNKVFDSTKVGSGFKFGLGRGEVIQGWDIGIVGMKVGGRRKIICPPNMAYGAKGTPPVIPPNSTLIFEVELKSVS